MSTRKEQKEKRRQDILVTALDIFVKKGYGATKITDISESLNMSSGLIFHYFPSKEKLYEELISIGLQALKQEISFDTEEPLKSLEEFIEKILKKLEDNPITAQIFVLIDQAQYLDILPDELKESLKESNKFIERSIPLIEHGQNKKMIKAGDPEALSIMFWTSLQGYAQHKAQNPACPTPKAKWFIDILKR